MKTVIILLCLYAGDLFAQSSWIVATKTDSLLLTKKNTKLLTLGSGLTVSHDTLSAGGGGSPTFENWSATDAGSPVQAPSVTAGTKGLSGGDSSSITGYGGIAFGNQTLASGQGAIALGSRVLFLKTQALAKLTVAVGAGCQANSTGTTACGGGIVDGCVYTGSNLLGGGGNTLGGEAASSSPGGAWDGVSFGGATAAKASYNTCTGFGSGATGSLNSLYGDGAQIIGMANVMLGNNVGTSATGTRICDVGLGYGLDGNLTFTFDSCFLAGAGMLTTYNHLEFLWGTFNTSTTGVLAQFSYGTSLTPFDCLRVMKDGTVVVGKAVSIPGGTSGQFLQTNGSGTNTWASPTAGCWSVTCTQGVFQHFVPANAGFTTLTNTSFPALASYSKLGANSVSFSGTARNLYVSSVANASNGTDQITIYKNGVATALTVTVGNTLKTGSDLVDSFTFSAGDFISIVYAAGGNFNDWEVSFELDTP